MHLQEVKVLIDKARSRERLGQSYLISGSCPKDLEEAARYLAQDFADHDICLLEPEGKSHIYSVESLRDFRKQAGFPPNVFIFRDAERMPPTSANALLKTFEEPLPDTLIILLTAHPEQLLQTIVSRCRHIRIQSQGEKGVFDKILEEHKGNEAVLDAVNQAKLSLERHMPEENVMETLHLQLNIGQRSGNS